MYPIREDHDILENENRSYNDEKYCERSNFKSPPDPPRIQPKQFLD